MGAIQKETFVDASRGKPYTVPYQDVSNCIWVLVSSSKHKWSSLSLYLLTAAFKQQNNLKPDAFYLLYLLDIIWNVRIKKMRGKWLWNLHSINIHCPLPNPYQQKYASTTNRPIICLLNWTKKKKRVEHGDPYHHQHYLLSRRCLGGYFVLCQDVRFEGPSLGCVCASWNEAFVMTHCGWNFQPVFECNGGKICFTIFLSSWWYRLGILPDKLPLPHQI